MDYKKKTIYLGKAMKAVPVKTEPAYPQIGKGPVYLAWSDKGGIMLKYELEGGKAVFEAPTNPADGHWTQLAWISNDGWVQLPQDMKNYIIHLVDASIQLRPYDLRLSTELKQVQFDLWRRICQTYDALTADREADRPEPGPSCKRLVDCWRKFDWKAYADLRNAIDKCFDDAKLNKIDCFRHNVNSSADICLEDWFQGELWLRLIDHDEEYSEYSVTEVVIPGEYLEDEGAIDAEIERIDREELKRFNDINEIKKTEEYQEYLRLQRKFKDIE